jgi:multidrug efflux pump subunit AcrA (membrane-fusion protein)
MSPTIDPETRSVGVIVEVDGPYRQAVPGIRPPLVKGAYVAVDIIGPRRPDSVAIPRAALHGDVVYVVDGENRLKRQVVEVELVQPEFVTVKKGLAAGDRLVVSDVVPAIEGMLLKPEPDQQSLTALTQAASGAAP